MFISEKDQKRFPKLAKYVRDEIPKLASDALVVDTIHDLVGLEKKAIRQALQWGNNPRIMPVRALVCTSEAAGCFRNANPDRIEIEERLVEDFEQGVSAEPLSTGANRVERVGAVLLHELVHWADYDVDQRHTSVRKPYHDVGSKFEWQVFATFLPEMEKS